MPSNRRNRLERLIAVAETAQQVALDLDRIFEGLEKRQLNLVQAGLQMGSVWLRVFGDIEKNGQSLAQILDILTQRLSKVSYRTTGINGAAGSNTWGGTNTGINGGIGGIINGGINGASQRHAAPYPLAVAPPINLPPININFNTPNLAGIERAEPQLASVLARAVKRGMRGL